MTMRKTAVLPAGGPLKIDAVVAELLLAQLALMCARRNDEHEKAASARRSALLDAMDSTQRGHASIVLRLLDERRPGKRAALSPPVPSLSPPAVLRCRHGCQTGANGNRCS
jgi:hypothetical protein